MSIIDNLLVLLDDEKERTLDEIIRSFSEYSRQVISASLGRMASKKLIKKNKRSKTYLIDNKGQKLITETLNNLGKFENPNESNVCHFVLFNIPEKERVNRDIMRNYLSTNGFGRLHNTVWISTTCNIDNLKKIIASLNILDKSLLFSSDITRDNMESIIKFSTWDFDKLNKGYREFIKLSESFLKSKNKDSLYARCVVYLFAKSASLDPKLPAKLINQKYLGNEAYAIYKKIRKFCY